MTRRLAPLVVCVLFGCAADAPPPLYPVTGVLAQGSKPVSGGGLILIPESGGWAGAVVNASVNADGTFTVQTSRAGGSETKLLPGAPAGRYKVAFHPPGDGQKVGGEYHFPDAVAVEAKDNVLALTLPDDVRLPKKADPKGPPAPNPADGGKDD